MPLSFAAFKGVYRLAQNALVGLGPERIWVIGEDFKRQTAEDMARVANYRRQLEVYSHIVEEKLGKSVSKMHLYYTRTEGESPYVSWDFNPERVEGTLKKFGETVKSIESHRFSNKGVVKCERLCDGCDMRFYCNYK